MLHYMPQLPHPSRCSQTAEPAEAEKENEMEHTQLDPAHEAMRDTEANRLRRIEAAALALLEACKWAAKGYHHPACKCKGEYAANPERYCNCHVQACRAAIAQAEGE